MKRPTNRRAMDRQERAAAKIAVLKDLRAIHAIASLWAKDSVYVGWARESRERARLLRVAMAAVRKAGR